jgi:hypothetical protein
LYNGVRVYSFPTVEERAVQRGGAEFAEGAQRVENFRFEISNPVFLRDLCASAAPALKSSPL